jgi:hypothetical protein
MSRIFVVRFGSKQPILEKTIAGVGSESLSASQSEKLN